MEATKAFLSSLESSSSTNAAEVIELSCNMFLLLGDEVDGIRDMIRKMDYRTSKQTIADRVSMFLETLFWFKDFLYNVQASVLSQEIPKTLILHKELFSELCDETLKVDIKDENGDWIITSSGIGRLSSLCRSLGTIIDRKLFGCSLKCTVDDYATNPHSEIRIISLSQILSSEKLAKQEELLDMTIHALPETTLTIKDVNVNAVAATIVLPRLARWDKIVFEGCTFDFDALFIILGWSNNEYTKLELYKCTLPSVLEDTVSDKIRFTNCTWK